MIAAKGFHCAAEHKITRIPSIISVRRELLGCWFSPRFVGLFSGNQFRQFSHLTG